MTLETNKTLGGVGALLMVIAPFLSVYGSILGLIGIILVLIALKGMSDHYNEGGIFNNALYGFIMPIIGGVIFVAILIWAAVGLLSDLGLELNTLFSDPTALQSINWQASGTLEIILNYIPIILGSFLLLFVFVVVASIFLRKSLTLLSAKTGVNLFGTTGLLMLIGAVLTIILVGFIILWIALILLAIAFFSIKPQPAQPPGPTPSTQ